MNRHTRVLVTTQQLVGELIICLIAMTKMLDKHNLDRKDLFWLTV